ncbi:hypothetical protein D3C76_1486840 [compost metagenome]
MEQQEAARANLLPRLFHDVRDAGHLPVRCRAVHRPDRGIPEFAGGDRGNLLGSIDIRRTVDLRFGPGHPPDQLLRQLQFPANFFGA